MCLLNQSSYIPLRVRIVFIKSELPHTTEGEDCVLLNQSSYILLRVRIVFIKSELIHTTEGEDCVY